ncbi:hypothetical protein LZ31DRAFT_182242 [Colletotrichum somersetense]|nr:hypothetical protein LZ31DRAFT_182242 [Colletotrichum somersetense]
MPSVARSLISIHWVESDLSRQPPLPPPSWPCGKGGDEEIKNDSGRIRYRRQHRCVGILGRSIAVQESHRRGEVVAGYPKSVSQSRPSPPRCQLLSRLLSKPIELGRAYWFKTEGTLSEQVDAYWFRRAGFGLSLSCMCKLRVCVFVRARARLLPFCSLHRIMAKSGAPKIPTETADRYGFSLLGRSVASLPGRRVRGPLPGVARKARGKRVIRLFRQSLWDLERLDPAVISVGRTQATSPRKFYSHRRPCSEGRLLVSPALPPVSPCFNPRSVMSRDGAEAKWSPGPMLALEGCFLG